MLTHYQICVSPIAKWHEKVKTHDIPTNEQICIYPVVNLQEKVSKGSQNIEYLTHLYMPVANWEGKEIKDSWKV